MLCGRMYAFVHMWHMLSNGSRVGERSPGHHLFSGTNMCNNTAVLTTIKQMCVCVHMCACVQVCLFACSSSLKIMGLGALIQGDNPHLSKCNTEAKSSLPVYCICTASTPCGVSICKMITLLSPLPLQVIMTLLSYFCFG